MARVSLSIHYKSEVNFMDYIHLLLMLSYNTFFSRLVLLHLRDIVKFLKMLQEWI